MESIPPILLQALLAFLILAGGVYYFAVAREMAMKGGRVSLQYFGLPDLFMGTVLALYFGLNGLQVMLKSESAAELKAENVRMSFGFMLVVLLVVLLFARMRRLPLQKAFHLDEQSFVPMTAVALLREKILLRHSKTSQHLHRIFWIRPHGPD